MLFVLCYYLTVTELEQSNIEQLCNRVTYFAKWKAIH